MELGDRLKLCCRTVPLLLVSGPTVLLAVSSALWSSVIRGGFGDPIRSCTSFAFLQSVGLADPSRSAEAAAAPLVDFLVPSARVRSKGPPKRQVSTLPEFRLQGLVTLLTVYSL
jgi:hypothetical protein